MASEGSTASSTMYQEKNSLFDYSLNSGGDFHKNPLVPEHKIQFSITVTCGELTADLVHERGPSTCGGIDLPCGHTETQGL